MFDFIGGRGRAGPRPSPQEEVEDFFSDRANYFPRLETAAEAHPAPRSLAVPGPIPGGLVAQRSSGATASAVAPRPVRVISGIAGERLSPTSANSCWPIDWPRSSARFRLARLIGHAGAR